MLNLVCVFMCLVGLFTHDALLQLDHPVASY